ncbi:NAD(P)-dependent oxidoreductase [Kribbella pratensis]|jgi:putative NADH-flavin reductase|uniref:NADH-flavin reductase n=1 Tax=Kribbella pratensis TaxID=2512112 RepID=A0A4R8CPA0_9ACTN|nr:NAD(P)H-binding protein [Kribbella pratensis]TDW77953.1 putative NADH-flavin reductase [Kribbella pratensis]
MKLTIFAATGGVGRHLLEQAVTGGHEVTVVVRDPSLLTRRVRTVRADLASADPTLLAEAVSGADAVLSCLGPRGRAGAGIVSQGTLAIVMAMEASAVRRLVIVSVAGVATLPGPGSWSLIAKALSGIGDIVHHQHYADLLLTESLLKASELDWTAVGVPPLNDGAMSGNYRVATGEDPRPGLRLSRADAAHCMLAVLRMSETIRQSVVVSN